MRRALAPLGLSLGGWLLRSGLLGPRAKAKVFRMLETRLAYLGITREAATLFGGKLLLRSDDFLQRHAMLFGEWEPYLTRRLADRAPSDRLFIDIGANIGYVSLVAAQRFAKVYAIEAAPTVYRLLTDNLARNPDLAGRIEAHHFAVGAEAGEVEIFLASDANIGATSQFIEGGVLDGRVPVKPLTDILTAEDIARIGFIKIDVEGAEPAVLDGMAPLWDQLLDGVEMAVELSNTPEGDEVWRRIEALRAHGFRAHMLQGTYSIEEYLDPAARSPLTPLDARPEEFCEVLLVKGAA